MTLKFVSLTLTIPSVMDCSLLSLSQFTTQKNLSRYNFLQKLNPSLMGFFKSFKLHLTISIVSERLPNQFISHPKLLLHLHKLLQFFKSYFLDLVFSLKWFSSFSLQKCLLFWFLLMKSFFNFQRMLDKQSRFNFFKHLNFQELSRLVHDELIWKVWVRISF